jgi:hypothetical protein
MLLGHDVLDHGLGSITLLTAMPDSRSSRPFGKQPVDQLRFVQRNPKGALATLPKLSVSYRYLNPSHCVYVP